MEDLQKVILGRIYEIRGRRVILDRDIAELYGVETKVLNQAVKRNIERFPEDFMFQLTKEEMENWKSQIVTSNSIKMGLRRPPFAFTEHGVTMLSSVLRSDTAIQINIGIVRAFVALRGMMAEPLSSRMTQLESQVKYLRNYMEDVFADQNDINEDTRIQLELISRSLAELQPREPEAIPRRKIGYV